MSLPPFDADDAVNRSVPLSPCPGANLGGHSARAAAATPRARGRGGTILQPISSMLRIGITGGIGSGKSIASRVFQALGVPIYDADSRARGLMENDGALRTELQAAFGDATYDEAGRLNRPALAAAVFHDPIKLAQLNGLVHPHVGTDFERWAGRRAPRTPLRAEGSRAALRGGLLPAARPRHHRICAMPVRVARVLRRDPQRSPAEVAAIMAKQLSEEEKRRLADYVLVNDDVQPLLPQILDLHAQFPPQPAKGKKKAASFETAF